MFEESAADAWKLRFGSEPPVGAESVEGMLRHRCVRHYAEREVPESLVASLIGAAQSAATSSNLQLWSVVSVQDSVRRNLIADFAGDQHQIREAPWFFAFIVDLNRIGQLASPMGYGEFLDYTEYEIMGIVDCAIAAERMVCAAESAGLGICYIGAMRNDPYRARELLSLPPQTFCPFGLCLGFPAEDSAEIKPRLKADSVWFRESYGNPDTREYDERMRPFYESQGMKGEFTWSMRSARRLSSLSGREALLGFLREQRLGWR